MKTFVVLALFSVAVFVVVIRMRPDILPSSYSSRPAAAANPIPPSSPAEKEKKNSTAPARTSRAARPVEPPVAFPFRYEVQLQPAPQTANPSGHRLAKATVTADTLPVYATNSSASRIVKVLNKGDQIQTDLAVIDSQGHWSLITVPGQRISGYVHTEDIDLRRIRTED